MKIFHYYPDPWSYPSVVHSSSTLRQSYSVLRLLSPSLTMLGLVSLTQWAAVTMCLLLTREPGQVNIEHNDDNKLVIQYITVSAWK